MKNLPLISSVADYIGALAKKAMPSNFRQSLYYVHPDEKLFEYNFRHDVTRADCPIAATGTFIIMDFQVPKSQYWIIKGLAPYAMERTNAAGLTESARYIDPQDGNGWFSFQPVTAGESTITIQTNVNAPTNMAAAGLDSGMRQKSGGITDIYLDPRRQAWQSMINPFFVLPVKSEQRFQVLFSLLGPAPVAPGVAINNPYVIGNPTPPNQNKRVDFAGVVVTGVMLKEEYYADVAGLFEKGKGW